MEIITFILIFGGIIGGLYTASKQDNHNTVKRALTIGKSHKQAAIEAKSPEDEVQISQAQLQKLFDDALEAQRKEQKILAQNWENEFLELLPDTDPQKNAHNMRKSGINVIEANLITSDKLYIGEKPPVFIEPEIGYTGEQLTYCDRIVTKPSAYVRELPTDDSDFTATFQKGAVIRVYGWMRGRYVGKTDVWYQVKTHNFQGWVWSGSLNSSSTDGLARLEFARQARPKIVSKIEQEVFKREARAAHMKKWH